MKLTNVKGFVTKAVLGTVAAGALLFAAPTKSQAQVFIGLRFGHPAPVLVAPAPVYVAPAPYGFYARRDAWIRAHRYYGHGYYR